MLPGGGGYQIVRTGLPNATQQFAAHAARINAHLAAGGTVDQHPTLPNVQRLYSAGYPEWRKALRAHDHSRFARRINAVADCQSRSA
jgi:hypothetical protein